MNRYYEATLFYTMLWLWCCTHKNLPLESFYLKKSSFKDLAIHMNRQWEWTCFILSWLWFLCFYKHRHSVGQVRVCNVLDHVNRRDRFSMKKPLRSSARGASFHTKHASNANIVRVLQTHTWHYEMKVFSERYVIQCLYQFMANQESRHRF
jgi:hypothetical protein